MRLKVCFFLLSVIIRISCVSGQSSTVISTVPVPPSPADSGISAPVPPAPESAPPAIEAAPAKAPAPQPAPFVIPPPPASPNKQAGATAPKMQSSDNGEIYKLNLAADIPIILVCGGFSGYAFTKIYTKENSTIEQIENLDKKDIPSFDRWAAGFSDPKADMVSDYFFYGSIPSVFTLLLDKEIRHDAGKISLMYLEAMSITGLFYTGSVLVVDRYRPETYNTDLLPTERTSGNNKDAFIAGHPALVATATFFGASVYSNYHPESSWKYVGYGIAIAATGTTVYLRHIAGKHFPSDLLAGTAIGTLSGLLVPRFHKIKAVKDGKLGLYPFGYGDVKGLTAMYKF